MGAAAYLGDRSHFQVFIAGRDQPVAVAVQNQALSSTERDQPGQRVWLGFASESVVLLAPE